MKNIPQRFRDELRYLLEWVREHPEQIEDFQPEEMKYLDDITFDEETNINLRSARVDNENGVFILVYSETIVMPLVLTWLPLRIFSKAAQDYSVSRT